MSRLMDEIREDPNAVFGIEADLPSGNRLIGAIGPMVGDRLSCELTFASPPSEEDMAYARATANQLIGHPPQFVIASTTKADHDKARHRADQFLREGIN